MAETVKRENGFALRFLYHTAPGRGVLRLLTRPGLSRLCGRFLDSRLSRRLIGGFVKKHHIAMEDYEPCAYGSFNDFFTRRIRPERRPIDPRPEALIAPCDGRLSVYAITPEAEFSIKGSRYTVGALLGGAPEAAGFDAGACLVFRLCVDDYHRYCYFDDGEKGENHFLPGRLHTVRPIALERYPVFMQNCREYTLLHTRHFGLAAQIEVGALMVGRIKNLQGSGAFLRGQEKGMFLYGGSTVVVLLQKDTVQISPELWQATAEGRETRVRMGQCIARAVKKEGQPVPAGAETHQTV